MAIEIVDLPIKKVIFHSYVSLPEGTPWKQTEPCYEQWTWLGPGGFKTYPQNMLKRHLNQSNQSSLL